LLYFQSKWNFSLKFFISWSFRVNYCQFFIRKNFKLDQLIIRSITCWFFFRFIYLYIYIFIYLYIYIFIYLYIYIFIYLHIYIFIYLYIWITFNQNQKILRINDTSIPYFLEQFEKTIKHKNPITKTRSYGGVTRTLLIKDA